MKEILVTELLTFDSFSSKKLKGKNITINMTSICK